MIPKLQGYKVLHYKTRTKHRNPTMGATKQSINNRTDSVVVKVRKRAKIRNRYNQAPHLTQDTKGKVTTSQLNITNESQEVSPFPAGVTRHKQTDVHEIITKQDRNNINDPQKKHRLGTVSKILYWRALTGLTVHQPHS